VIPSSSSKGASVGSAWSSSTSTSFTGRPEGRPGRGQEWSARELGYARSIGVSNFAVGEIDDLLQQAEQPPVVNQVLFNPFAYRKRLFEACAADDIVLEA